MLIWKGLKAAYWYLPYPILKICGSSERLVSLANYFSYGYNKKPTQYYNLLKKMQTWSLDKIYEFQFERLRNLLEHAYKNVPYYKGIFNKERIKPSDIKCLEDLDKLPIITKDDVLTNYNKFFARNSWYKCKMYYDTSGTSGRSLRACIDNNHMDATIANIRYFINTFLGYTYGKEIVLFIAFSKQTEPSFIKDGYFGFYNPVTKQVMFSWHFIGDEAFKKCTELIKKFSIKHIESVPSVAFAFAKYLANKNEHIKIKTFLLGAEVLYEPQRKFIEKYLGCEVFNSYGQMESTTVTSECSCHKGMHILPLSGVAEVKDYGLKGKGELVMTGLQNYSWPLIRYNIKDVVVLSQKKCECGCSFPRLMSIKGRSNDFIMLPGGGYLDSTPFIWFNINIRGVKDIFFLQEKDYSLNIFTVKEEKSDTAEIKSNILLEAKRLTKNKLKINIEFVDKIERKSRKYKVVETKVPAFLEFKKCKIN